MSSCNVDKFSRYIYNWSKTLFFRSFNFVAGDVVIKGDAIIIYKNVLNDH